MAAIRKTPEGVQVRLEEIDRLSLIAMGLFYAVVIAKDVSMRVPGAIEAAFSHERDASREALRLDAVYDESDAFVVVDVRTLS